MSFNIVFNSNDGTGTDLFNLEYTFDFSFMEECEYELSFSFVSGLQDEGDYFTDTRPLQLAIQNFPLRNVFKANDKMRSETSNVLGLIDVESILLTNTYYLKYNSHPSNTPVRCMRPSNNVFRVQLLNYAGNLLTDFEEYSLILNFKKRV